MNGFSKVVQALFPIKEEQAEKALVEAAREGDLATLTRLVEERVNLEAKLLENDSAYLAAQVRAAPPPPLCTPLCLSAVPCDRGT